MTNIAYVMTNQCPKCGKDFQSQAHLDRHLRRKTPCDGKHQSHSQKYSCKFCSKGFSLQPALSRHENHYCPKRTASQQAAQPKEDLSGILAKITELQSSAASSGVYLSLVPTLDVHSHHVHKDNRVTHNTLVQGDVSGTKIVINNFGEEDLSDMLDDVGKMLDALPSGTPGEGVISSAMSLIYNNPKRPQNRTVRITNKRDNVPSIKVGDTWVNKSEIELYPTMIKVACKFLEDNQDYTLGDRLASRPKLAYRSAHVRNAFDIEATMTKDEKMRTRAIRPLLYQ